MRRLIVVTGTGTEIGKTHVACALLRAAAPRGRVLGYKPVESGVVDGIGEDGERLRAFSTFHVQPSPHRFLFEAPISPHQAARAEGRSVDLTVIEAEVARLRELVDVLLVELPGGLYSPLRDDAANADLVRRFPDARVVLLAPDRLGVLHDLGATTRAARTDGIRLSGIVLSAPAAVDASTGRNAAEVRLVTDVPLLASVPRAPVEQIAPTLTGAIEALLA